MEEIVFKSWKKYREFVASQFGRMTSYVFRGHADSSWKLESTLTRLISDIPQKLTPEDVIEQTQLNAFKMKIRGLRGPNPPSLNDNELWSLGQHYGLATPLLDWTRSPYIASFFAFENPISCKGKWRTVYALSQTAFGIASANIKNNIEFIDPLTNDNNRIIAQAGIFIKIPTRTDLESWLSEKGLDKHLLKMKISNNCRLDALNDLNLMNITGATLFPDLLGASEACNRRIEVNSKNIEQYIAEVESLSMLVPKN